ncbi:colicin transporter [Paraburkholderia sp. J12]|uniref:colicin transporter n=1 Tax=Paraburkholderia sp. J12 TaxID=2805432 RepID=UPI0039F5EF2B
MRAPTEPNAQNALPASAEVPAALGGVAPQNGAAAPWVASGTGVTARPLDAVSASSAGATDSVQAGFDARQKVLDRRTAENNYRYGVAQHDCYSTFFVNHCLGKARDQMRVEQADIRSQQLQLDEEQRADHARRRDEQAALQRAQDEADAPQRAANDARNAAAYEQKQQQHVLDQQQRAAEAPQRAANEQAYQQKLQQHALDQAQRQGEQAQAQRSANQAAYDQKQSDFQQKLDEAHRQGQQKAAEREQKAERYQQKQEDAAKHKADVEERQKQAAEKAQQKQQQQQQAQPQQQPQDQ